jgi:DNA topoisomerase-1
MDIQSHDLLPAEAAPPPADEQSAATRQATPRQVVRHRALSHALRRAHLSLADTSALTIRRRRAGKGFVYVDETGERVTDEETLARIRSLAIPPAYTDVRIAADPRAHLQAIGRDQAGRTQHRYHPDWTLVREERKAERLALVIDVLPKIRSAVRRDIGSAQTCKDKAVACAIALIDNGHIRVGCEAYARDNGSHGAATLLKRHVSVEGPTITLAFRGKSGKDIRCAVEDQALADALLEISGLRGRRLLQYRTPEGRIRPISASDVNAYLQRVSGVDVTAKDFRMLGASASAASELAAMEPATSETARRRQLAGVMKAIAARLANTPAVVRESYVHELVVRSFETGTLAKIHRVARGGRDRARAEVVLGRLVARVLRR